MSGAGVSAQNSRYPLSSDRGSASDMPLTNSETSPANTGYSFNVASMLVHRFRRWPNIEATLNEYPVFAVCSLRIEDTYVTGVRIHQS